MSADERDRLFALLERIAAALERQSPPPMHTMKHSLASGYPCPQCGDWVAANTTHRCPVRAAA